MPAQIVYLADLAHTQAVTDASLTVPLNIGYVSAYAKAALGDAVEIRLFKHPEKLLAAVAERRPDVVGIANYGWNEHLNRQIGKYLRRQLPEALMVIGGPNIDPEEARRVAMLRRHDYADFAVVDGGEEPFAELLTWWRDDRGDHSRLPRNLLWLEDGGLRRTTERPLAKQIDGIPSPYLGGFLDEFLAAGMVPLFETNRGCPFACTFCAWGMASKDLVRRFDLETSLQEVRYVGERSRARNWIVCDANFGILKRDVEVAREIRAVREKRGTPQKCHVWLAKNVTDRNLEIGSILGDMVVPVMAVQSLDEQVLKNIKRDNISLDTYRKYQEKFHALGSATYSDVIVPLPAETLQTHLSGLRELFAADVDVIQNHNMRLLAGAETNSTETRTAYAFQTRYRLIHGDAGAYRAPNGEEIAAFEIEESLRSTATMTEAELFHLRKLHFLVDFCWNIDVYKRLLKLGRTHGQSPVDVLQSLLSEPTLAAFWAEFDAESQAEWFDTEDDIRDYFSEPQNWQRLVGQEFDKLNIKYSVRVLEAYKETFDAAILAALRGGVPSAELATEAAFTFAEHPPLSESRSEVVVDTGAASRRRMRLVPSTQRRVLLEIVSGQPGLSVSKILNTQGYRLRDLRYEVVGEVV